MRFALWQNFRLRPTIYKRECTKMKNPLDSLGQTVILGFVLTLIVAVLIPVIGG